MTAKEVMQDKVKIRPMEPEDITAVLEIDRKIGGVQRAVTYETLPPGDLGGEIDLSFVAQVGSQVVGFILANRTYVGEPVVEGGLIQILGVDPSYRRQGIATKLVNSVLECCRSRGYRSVRIMVNERDRRLRSLFVHMDFRRGQLVDYIHTL